jgi:hypothetical protein
LTVQQVSLSQAIEQSLILQDYLANNLEHIRPRMRSHRKDSKLAGRHFGFHPDVISGGKVSDRRLFDRNRHNQTIAVTSNLAYRYCPTST